MHYDKQCTGSHVSSKAKLGWTANDLESLQTLWEQYWQCSMPWATSPLTPSAHLDHSSTTSYYCCKQYQSLKGKMLVTSYRLRTSGPVDGARGWSEFCFQLCRWSPSLGKELLVYTECELIGHWPKLQQPQRKNRVRDGLTYSHHWLLKTDTPQHRGCIYSWSLFHPLQGSDDPTAWITWFYVIKNGVLAQPC